MELNEVLLKTQQEEKKLCVVGRKPVYYHEDVLKKLESQTAMD